MALDVPAISPSRGRLALDVVSDRAQDLFKRSLGGLDLAAQLGAPFARGGDCFDASVSWQLVRLLQLILKRASCLSFPSG